jgi:DNA-binding NtrC family response regulator
VSDALRLLVVEDDPGLAEVTVDELAARGHRVVVAGTVAAARELLAEQEFDVALMDLMLPDGSGIDVLRTVREQELPTQVIVLTGYATLATALEAMKLGAYDYITKPSRLDEIEIVVGKAAEKARLLWENAALRVRLEAGREAFPGLIGQDPALKQLLSDLEKVASSPLPVLVLGESGTGKELVARAVHKRSPRAHAPFVPVNCAAIPENLLESELFGAEKGAFTGALNRRPGLFEAADRGVLFLDEIGEVSLSVQAKLLRAIETREFFRVGSPRPVQVDIRIVTATNKDLRAESESGGFREDLYYRLNGVTLRLPPLRARPGDIPLLAAHFLERAGGRKRLSRGAAEKLLAYGWPGNVRELQMVVQRAAVLSQGDVIEAGEVHLDPPRNWRADAIGRNLTLAELERQYIEEVLARHDGHRGRAAAALGIDPKTLYNKLGAEKAKRQDR